MGQRTFGVVLKNLQVHVGVCDDDVEFAVEGEEFNGDGFEVVLAAAEESHFVWLFLWCC